MRFCVCIFESDTVKVIRKSMEYLKISYRLLVYLTSFTVFFLEILKKALK